MHTGLGGLYRIKLIMNRGGRASQVVNFVNLNIQRKRNIVANDLEMRIPQQMKNIIFTAGKKIIRTQDIVPKIEQAFAQMRA